MFNFLKRITVCIAVPIFLLFIMIAGMVLIYIKLIPSIKKVWAEKEWGWELFKLQKR